MSTGPEQAFVRLSTKQLLHHQLRVLPVLHWMNARYAAAQIRRAQHDWIRTPDIAVINFNYDFYFLRSVFPTQRIITIVNDDFATMSRLPFTHHIKWALRRTCMMSDSVLAVSSPLRAQLSEWCDPQLFLPWSADGYHRPVPDVSRRTILLYWGYINIRLDMAVVDALARHLMQHRPTWRIQFVGPRDGRSGARVCDALAKYSNVEVLGERTLSELPTDRVLAALIPYQRVPFNDAIMLSNKTVQLLSRGLPLLISGMPAFIERPFIRRLDSRETIGQVLDSCMANFNRWQDEIESFVDENSAASRLQQLTALVG